MDPGSALILFGFSFCFLQRRTSCLVFMDSIYNHSIICHDIGFRTTLGSSYGKLAIILLQYFKSRAAHRNPILSGLIFLVITGFVYSVNYVFENVFKQHHRDRFNILLGKQVDMKGIGYNLNQSEIAIGSGGWLGKGFLEGTQTKGGFVPEQHTDYIFTTVGEEWGFAGTVVVILLFIALIFRIVFLAERQKTKFSRVYGYCVASILFIHFFVNTAMVIGVFPTIGVPLPFFSYGGSGLWGFTILLFIFVKMDANKVNEW